MAQAGTGQVDMDFGCNSGPRAPAWQAAKNIFRSLYVGPGASPLTLPSPEALKAALDGALAELKKVGAPSPDVDECGLGKLSLQLLSVATVADPVMLVPLFQSMESLASPVLTTLLDVPLALTGQAGWPIFGMLSTINLRKSEVPEALNAQGVDGLADDVGLLFLAELSEALQAGDIGALTRAGAAYLNRPSSPGSALAPLTALATQAISNEKVQERLSILQTMQDAMRQVIGNAAELDVALSTRWPLWALTQMSIDGFVA